MRDDYYTYILTNYSKTVLYTGTTHDLLIRLLQHYSNRGSMESFTSRYSCFYLVWYDSFPTMRAAIEAEKYIKGKNRVWKEALIARQNPEWRFLNEDIVGVWPPDQEFMKSIPK
ncbi:MAG: GIY-YIG nuclease family protein [Cyanothece sp. SIO1E1]|nr:GIY-YIG nuclease family protein [Cyanothece sp. SIO1E1]